MREKRKIRWWLVALPVAGALWGAWRLGTELALEAEGNDEPPPAVLKSFGRGGVPGIVHSLVQTGSTKAEAESAARVVRRKLGKDWAGSFIVVGSTTGFHHVKAYRGKRRAIVGPGSPGVDREPVEEQLKRAQGVVGSNLPASLHAAGVPAVLHQDFADVFRWSADMMGDAQTGDRFSLAWTERTAGGRPLTHRLEAAVFQGKETGKHQAIRWDGEFFDRKGLALRRHYLRSPLRYKSISSSFGGFRFSPLGWPMRRHRGTDFAARLGTPVISVADGTVAFLGAKGEYGNLVIVRHPSNRQTFYGHLGRYGPGIRKGSIIRQGQVLGYVGITGNSTGPHLHFELRRDGETQDFRAAELPGEAIGLASRPRRFAARWKELLEP